MFTSKFFPWPELVGYLLESSKIELFANERIDIVYKKINLRN